MKPDVTFLDGAETSGLLAPFPYFGGKRSVVTDVWQRLGSPKQYIEPFCGSAAVLLAAPAPAALEVVNDASGFIANFWRATKHQAEAVAEWADYPVSHIDLGARHVWLMAQRGRIGAGLHDPDWPGDAKVAGWWLWGQCCWIGSGWCDWAGPARQRRREGRAGDWEGDDATSAGMGVQAIGKVPHAGNAGRGVQAIGQVPHAGDAGRGVQAIGQVPHAGNAGRGVQAIGKVPHATSAGMGVQAIGQVPHATSAGMGVQAIGQVPQYNESGRGILAIGKGTPSDGGGMMTSCGRTALAWLGRLADRLERVRIVHGDWTRCLNHHFGGDNTAVFLDPPYRAYEKLYGNSTPVADAVAEWAREHAHLRIALCGHQGDYDLPGWDAVEWSRGRLTYSGGKTTDKECIWYSPACLKPVAAQRDLFIEPPAKPKQNAFEGFA